MIAEARRQSAAVTPLPKESTRLSWARSIHGMSWLSVFRRTITWKVGNYSASRNEQLDAVFDCGDGDGFGFRQVVSVGC